MPADTAEAYKTDGQQSCLSDESVPLFWTIEVSLLIDLPRHIERIALSLWNLTDFSILDLLPLLIIGKKHRKVVCHVDSSLTLISSNEILLLRLRNFQDIGQVLIALMTGILI